ncbi:MAG: hypothetical protein AAF993_23090, partial [Pseudomonadota bacterium]
MKRLVMFGLCFCTFSVWAHQPVMDMAPRWDGGYGVQTRVEHFDDTTTTWVEGVYTWDRSIRATFKLPYRDGRVGDLILGMPLKKYINAGASTANWSITPSVQLPTGEEGEWDVGVSFSYSSETPRFYQLYDLYSWGDRTGLDINAGFAFPGRGSGMFALWDISALHSEEGDWVQTGPVFVYFKR